MYCKNKIYGGVEEVQFEELRAVKHTIRKQQEEESRSK